MPSSYLKFAVDFDGNGRRDLVHSVPDVLASTANFLRNYGWQRRRRLVPGIGQFRRHQGMEQGRPLCADDRLFATRLAGE
jgi:membrane-bound lytic murein transglycosylase B